MPYHTKEKNPPAKKKNKTKKANHNKTNMKEIKKNYSKKHIDLMERFMRGGLSMEKAHNLVIKMAIK